MREKKIMILKRLNIQGVTQLWAGPQSVTRNPNYWRDYHLILARWRLWLFELFVVILYAIGKSLVRAVYDRVANALQLTRLTVA